MNITQKQKKAEAVKRMKALKIFPQTVKQFEKENLISISEAPVGAFYWADKEELPRIHDFEEQYNALVYLVIRSYTTIGKMDSYLYVSDYPEEWDRDRYELETGEPLCYVYNYDMPDYSEFGCIGIQLTPAAGLIRTW